jgi:hypothetical protein
VRAASGGGGGVALVPIGFLRDPRARAVAARIAAGGTGAPRGTDALGAESAAGAGSDARGAGADEVMS